MKKILITISMALISAVAYSQSVGIGTTSPNTNSTLDIVSTNKGLLIPRADSNTIKGITLTAAENGMIMYANDVNAFVYWDGDSLDWFLLNENIQGGNNGFDDDWAIGYGGVVDTVFNDNAYVLVGGNPSDVLSEIRMLVQNKGTRTALAAASTGDGNSAIAVEGFATGSNSTNIGVLGIGESITSSDTVAGVIGKATSVKNIGVAIRGEVDVVGGTGSKGIGGTFFVVDSTGGADIVGIEGIATSTGSLANDAKGVYGSASGASTNWAGYFQDGNVYVNNNLGIGTFPSTYLHISKSATGANREFVRLENTDNSGGSTVSLNLSAGTGANNALGYISTASLGYTGVPGTEGYTSLTNVNNGVILNAANTGGNIKFMTGNSTTPKMFINNIGNVGVGTTSPNSNFEVRQDGGLTQWYARIASANATFDKQVLMGIYDNRAMLAAHKFSLSEYEELYLNGDGISGGNVFITDSLGIGNTNPQTRLDITGKTKTDSLKVVNGGGTLGNVLTDDGTGNAVWVTPAGATDTDWTINGSAIYNTSHNVGIGTNNPIMPLHVQTADNNVGGMIIGTASSTGSEEPYLYLTKSRGTSAIPLAISQFDLLGGISFNGYDGTDFEDGVDIKARATQDWGGTGHGAAIAFQTANNNTTA